MYNGSEMSVVRTDNTEKHNKRAKIDVNSKQKTKVVCNGNSDRASPLSVALRLVVRMLKQTAKLNDKQAKVAMEK